MSQFEGLRRGLLGCMVGLATVACSDLAKLAGHPAMDFGDAPDRDSRRKRDSLSPDDVRALEGRVAAQPDDFDARSRLLEHYFLDFSPEGRAARRPHALWVIANAPDTEIAGSPYAEFHSRLDPGGYEEARGLWLAHVGREAAHPAVIANAARFFIAEDRPLADRLLRRGAELEPSNPRWQEDLGHLLMLDARHAEAQPAQASSKKALAQYEAALEKTEGEAPRYYALDNVAEAALLAGEDEKAREYASELLRLADQVPKDWNYGNAIHEGHRILGHLALRAGDVEGAKDHLLKAGATPGSPQLNSFGPEFTLAEALLAKGQTDAVIQYLELCSKFWEGRTEALNNWIALIRAGRTPKLDGFAAARSDR